MKLSAKVIVAVLVVTVLAGALLMAQCGASSPKVVKLTAHDMEVLVSEVFPPGQQKQLEDAEQRKQLAKRLKQLLALAGVAEVEGYADKPEVQAQISLQADLALREAYDKKNPGAKATDDEINAYHKSHPNEFNNFIEASPQFKQQAQGPQGETIKREFGQIKVLAERARKDGLGDDEASRLRMLLERSQVLARAYVTDLQKDNKLVTDADVDEYYQSHQDEFDEVRARHILISASAEEADDQGAKPKSKPDADKKPKALSKDEARKKAESILARVRKGEDFAKLAGEFSDDPGSKAKGGLLDVGGSEYFSKGAMVPEFEKAAFSLKPGDVSEIIESQFGFHIIKVEDRRTAPLSDPATKQKITDTVKQDKLEKRIEEIAAASKVEVAEEFNVIQKDSPQPQPASGPSTPPGQ